MLNLFYLGFHPYASLPQKFMDLIYSGSIGNQLLHRDASLLGLKIVSEMDILRDLISKGTNKDTKALEALTKTITQIPESTSDAKNTKAKFEKDVIEKAKKNLSRKETQFIRKTTRKFIDTGFGTHHENEALDQYEKQIGWDVYSRNEDFLEWPFLEIDNTTCVKPMIKRARKSQYLQSKEDTEKKKQKSTGDDSSPTMIDLTLETETKVESVNSDNSSSEPKPFFYLIGKIDGIRDEPCFESDDNEEENGDEFGNMSLSQILIECKHRLNRISNPPPLYDQIQAVCYCLMLGFDKAEILQVLRKDIMTESGDNSAAQVGNEKKKQNMTISVSTVLLTDHYNHEKNFYDIVIPRLYSIVKAVYSIRCNDDLRYKFLLSTLNNDAREESESDNEENEEESNTFTEKISNSEPHEAWNIIIELCPWLNSCDTAYYREIQNKSVRDSKKRKIQKDK